MNTKIHLYAYRLSFATIIKKISTHKLGNSKPEQKIESSFN